MYNMKINVINLVKIINMMNMINLMSIISLIDVVCLLNLVVMEQEVSLPKLKMVIFKTENKRIGCFYIIIYQYCNFRIKRWFVIFELCKIS